MLDGSDSPYLIEDELCVGSPRPIHCVEAAMWMKQTCSPGNPCSPRRTCDLHLEHVELWSKEDSKLTALEGSDRRPRYYDIQKITRKEYLKETDKMKEMVTVHPELWPLDSKWETSRIELRDAVSRIIGTDPHRAAALSRLLRVLRVTPNVPANFQYKMATLAIQTTSTLQGRFEKAMNMGISIEELQKASPWADLSAD